MDEAGLEIATKMLAAIVYDNQEPMVVETVTLEEQMRYLKKYIDTIPQKERYDVGRVLVMNNRASNIISCSEGVVIDMDVLPEYIITQMYTMLKAKIEKLSK